MWNTRFQELMVSQSGPYHFIEIMQPSFPVAVTTFLLCVLLLYSELTYFCWPGLKFRFAPDADMHAKLKLNVDMTIAMPCDCKHCHI